MNTIEGVVESVVYKNEANGYAVCEIKHNNDTITVVGYIPYVNEGENLKVVGEWTTHPDYGQQFKVEYFEKIEPTTVDAIERYLSSGLIRGVGPATAKKLVERFREETIFVIENNPELLSQIKGISLDKAWLINQSFMEQRELKQVIMFLQEYKISPTFAVKIFKRFGSKTIEVVKGNPYKLADEVLGIGFKTADRIAMSLGVDKSSEHRLCAGIKYILSKMSGGGHTFAPKEELIKHCGQLLEAEEETVENALIRLTIDRQIFIENIGQYQGVYLAPFYYAELGVAKKILELSIFDAGKNLKDIDQKIMQIEEEHNIELGKLQKLAIKEAINNGVIVITGGPGTGKTTIIKSMLELFGQLNCTVALTAPTGRAAKRMSEACGIEAKTIHRLLEIGYVENGEEQIFLRNENNPLEFDVVIVDEVSMVDILLMNNLLKAMPFGSRLVLVGDTDQLPSVGPGRVLKDIIESEIVKVVRLTEIFRQAEESMIIVNAHKINKGGYPYLNGKGNDFFLVKNGNQQEILTQIIGLVKERLPKYNNYNPMEIQVLTPMRKGILGVLNLNNELQNVLNPPSKRKNEKSFRDMVFREGDKIMQNKNNYNITWIKASTQEEGTGVFNGDMGIIEKIDNESQTIKVIFDEERIVYFDFTQLDELELAYAVTVHKSQGSEFPVIVLPIFWGPQILLTRNLLYTAVTRAKELVVLVGKEEYLKEMIDNNNESKRYSGLEERIKNQLYRGMQEM